MYRMKSTARRILAMLLSLALLVSVLPTFALGADAAKDPLKKLDAKLVEALQNASATDQIPVWIWLRGFSSDYFDELVLREYGPEPGRGCTMEEADAYLMARRQIVRRETVAYNEKFAAEVLPEIQQSDYLYFGKYTSTLIAKLTAAQIRAAANDERVSSLNLFEDYQIEAEAAEKLSGTDGDLRLTTQICADYYASLKDPDISFEDVYIKQYLGCFNDYHIVVMGKLFADFQMVLKLNVGGFIFEFPSTGYSSLFLAYKDGVFTPVTEAYKSGMLSVKDIYDLYQAFYNNSQPPRFLDVRDPNAFYFEPVYWAYGAEITKGINNTRFGPNESCTRGQVVTFLWRAAGCPEPEKAETAFTDVSAKAFYAKAVAWAVEHEITNGMTDTTFGPDLVCTRAQVVTFLYRAQDYYDRHHTYDSCMFGDFTPNDFCYDAVLWAVENGVTKGTSETTFSPNNPCTRAQVVTFLYRASSIANAAGPMPSGSE